MTAAALGYAHDAAAAHDDGVDPIARLRRQIDDVIADAPAGGAGPVPGFATGLPALDAALRVSGAAGGVPRGRLTELLGAPGAGATTLARHLVGAVLACGTWVAYVDATRTLAAGDWVSPPAPADAPAGVRRGTLWVVRPPDPARAAWCADVLLRSGAFGCVVLDGAPVLPRRVALRLVQLAREADAACVLVGALAGGAGARASDLAGALRLRVRRSWPASRHGVVPWRARGAAAADGATAAGERGAAHPFAVTVEKGGHTRTVEVGCAVGVARRLCTHPEVPDRRPVARAAIGRGSCRDVVGDGDLVGDAAVGGADGRAARHAAALGAAGVPADGPLDLGHDIRLDVSPSPPPSRPDPDHPEAARRRGRRAAAG